MNAKEEQDICLAVIEQGKREMIAQKEFSRYHRMIIDAMVENRYCNFQINIQNGKIGNCDETISHKL